MCGWYLEKEGPRVGLFHPCLRACEIGYLRGVVSSVRVDLGPRSTLALAQFRKRDPGCLCVGKHSHCYNFHLFLHDSGGLHLLHREDFAKTNSRSIAYSGILHLRRSSPHTISSLAPASTCHRSSLLASGRQYAKASRKLSRAPRPFRINL